MAVDQVPILMPIKSSNYIYILIHILRIQKKLPLDPEVWHNGDWFFFFMYKAILDFLFKAIYFALGPNFFW